jgi:hypothetical protein
MEGYFAEKYNVALGLVPVDLNAGANTGLRISMKDHARVTFIVAMADSTGGVTDFTFNQHTAASAGSSKVLSHMNPYYKKVHTGSAVVTTKVQPAVAASNIVPTDFANEPGLVIFEVLAEDLDVEGGYAWVSLDMADATAAKPGAIIAIAHPKYAPGYAKAL